MAEASELAQLCREMLACTACGLARGRTRVVPGEGPDHADVMFIGEAPGVNEDRQGRPFVGAAGQFLDELLALAGLRRSEVYICNVIKCRPPGNRDPLPTEIQACRHWLDEQIRLVQPRVIVTLGRFSMARWFPGQSISRIHGKPAKHGEVLVFPMYHPAAALHQASLKQTLEEDMRALGRLLATLPPAGAVAPAGPQTASDAPLRLAAQPTQASLLSAAPAPSVPGPTPASAAPAPQDEPKQLSFF